MPDKNKSNPRSVDSVKKDALKLDATYKDIMSDVASSITGVSSTHDAELDRLNANVDRIINSELSDTKSITSDDMSTFMVKWFNDFDSQNTKAEKSLNDIFENDTSGLFQFFQQRYQNQNLKYEDLEMITQQLFELEEAVNTIRDAIITSDDISSTISRTLQFTNSGDDAKFEKYINTVTELERRLKLQTKIKNMVIPHTLRYGTYYVYCCPYAKLFQEQYDKKIKDPNHSKALSESIDVGFAKQLTEDFKEKNISISLEGVIGKGRTSDDKLFNVVKEYTDNIEVYNDTISIPLLEGVDINELIDNDKFNKSRDTAIKNIDKNAHHISTDGTVDTKSKPNQFKNLTGCYIKYIDPKKIVPIKILDTVIGYYYIHSVEFQVNRTPFSRSIRVTNTVNGQAYDNAEDVETMFLGKITDRIVKSFDKKFLEDNVQFKDLIFNALLYNNLYKKQIKFQFIPADYIVEFKVNEDPDGNGKSCLEKSLFYAKLYLSLLIFKMVSIVSRSNDQRIYYVKNSGLDNNITNKIQEVARSVKSRQINFMDLLNYNSILSKIGAFKELFIPVGRSGERGIEFDILQGQDIPMNTDLMEMLRTNMISGTGVPSVIMNYINEADYAKTLTMANSKFVGRVISYQMDLNEPITELYKLIMRNSNTSIPEEIIEKFQFTFNPPKTLNTTNMSDILNNTDQVVSYMVKILTGENSDQTPESNAIKDKLFKNLAMNYLPMLNWADAEHALKDAKIDYTKEKSEKALQPSDENGNSSY